MANRFEVASFVESCKAAVLDQAPALAVKELLLDSLENTAAIELALGTPDQAGMTTIYHGPDLTVLNLVWGPGMNLFPHEHLMWAVIGIYGGAEDNTFYRRVPRSLEKVGGAELRTKDATVLGRDIIHSVRNPNERQLTGAIHVYGGDFFGTPRSEWDPETHEERPLAIEHLRQAFAEANERWEQLRDQST